MKKPLCFVIGLPALAIVHCTSFAEPAQQQSSAAAPTGISALKKKEQSWEKIVKDCKDEWRANREAIMTGGMTEDSYVQQCSVKDDVPAIPQPKKTPLHRLHQNKSLGGEVDLAAPETKSKRINSVRA